MSGTASVTYAQPVTGSEAPAPVTNDEAAKAINATQTNGTAPPAATTERPAWLPEKFKSAEELAKAYADAQAELTRTKQAAAAPKPGEQTQTEQKPGEQKPGEQKPGTATEQAAQDAVSKAGLDVTPWQTEFNTTGDVSPEGRAKIAEALKAQFGENAASVVNDFIEGQKMRVANYQAQAHSVVGGAEQYGEMLAWAKSALSEAEQAVYNKAVDSMDINTMQLAVNGLKSKFETARGSAPNLLQTDSSIAGSNAAFASTFEMTKAMSDPRYGKDPVYTKAVEQRTMRSNF